MRYLVGIMPQQWERKPLIGYEESRPFEFGKRGIGRLAQPERVLTAGKDRHLSGHNIADQCTGLPPQLAEFEPRCPLQIEARAWMPNGRYNSASWGRASNIPAKPMPLRDGTLKQAGFYCLLLCCPNSSSIVRSRFKITAEASHSGSLIPVRAV